MSDGAMLIIAALIGPVVLVLVEAVKILAVLGWNKHLTGDGKLKAALIISFIMGTLAVLITGGVSIPGIVTDVMALVQNPPSFWEFIPALAGIFNTLATSVGVVMATSQAVYAMLKKKLKEVGWLAT